MYKRIKKMVVLLIAVTVFVPVLHVYSAAADEGLAVAVSGPTVYKGKDYALVYNCEYYSSHNPDLVLLYGNNGAKYIEHFVKTGMKECRQGSANFDPLSYKRAYPDIRHEFKNDYPRYYLHYMELGQAEGRTRTVGVTKIEQPIERFAGIDISPIYSFFEYMYANEDLRLLFADDDDAALAHFLEYGLLEGRMAKLNPDRRLANQIRPLAAVHGKEITTYRGIDLSPIFDTAYYLMNNPDVAKVVDYDPKATLDHFVQFGLDEGRSAKESFDPALYEVLREQVRTSDNLQGEMAEKANGYDSPTNYIMLVNKAAKRVGIFSGSKGNYKLERFIDCAIGALRSPTPSGIYHVGHKGLYFNTGTAGRCWYYTQIKGNYLFHSQIYDRSSSPVRLIDSRMSAEVSHGCIRLYLEDAKWIYDNVTTGSTIVVY